jgi:hypothetical protein
MRAATISVTALDFITGSGWRRTVTRAKIRRKFANAGELEKPRKSKARKAG